MKKSYHENMLCLRPPNPPLTSWRFSCSWVLFSKTKNLVKTEKGKGFKLTVCTCTCLQTFSQKLHTQGRPHLDIFYFHFSELISLSLCKWNAQKKISLVFLSFSWIPGTWTCFKKCKISCPAQFSLPGTCSWQESCAQPLLLLKV